jgi:hypothetical protein
MPALTRSAAGRQSGWWRRSARAKAEQQADCDEESGGARRLSRSTSLKSLPPLRDRPEQAPQRQTEIPMWTDERVHRHREGEVMV